MLKQRLAGTAVLFLMVFLAYWPSLQGGFIWDDRPNISQSPTKRTLEGLAKTWTDVSANQQYYPLSHTAFWVEWQLWGNATLGYHLVNTMLHACNAVLVWLLCRRLGLPGAWFAAAIFALHPVHVESVAWISELKNLLSALLLLTSALLLVRFAGRIQDDGPGSATGQSVGSGTLYLLSLATFTLSLLAKTTGGVAPAAFLAILWWRFGKPKYPLIRALIPFFLLGASASLVIFLVEKHHAGAQGAAFSWTLAERFIIAGKNVWFYVWRLIWPVNLAFLNPVWRLDTRTFTSYAPFALVLAVAGIAWSARKRAGTGPLAAWLSFLVMLFPAMGFLNFYFMRYSFVQDHFQYLASIGPTVLFSSALWSIGGRRSGPGRPHGASSSRVALVVPAAATLAALGFLTWSQNKPYADEETLWRDTLSKNPQAWMAHGNLSYILLEQARWPEVVAHGERALSMKPDLPEVLANVGIALGQMGRIDDGIGRLVRAVMMDPDLLEAHNALANLFIRKGMRREAHYHLDAAAKLSRGR